MTNSLIVVILFVHIPPKEEKMRATCSSIWSKDDRISQYVEKVFPDSPDFVKFLLRQMIELGVSFEFAQAFCRALCAAVPDNRPVSTEVVRRLDVDYCYPRIGCINRAFPEGGIHVAVANAIVFRTMLRAEICKLQNGDAILLPRQMIVLSDEALASFTQFFFIAQAMLSRVDVDPNTVPFEEEKLAKRPLAKHDSKLKRVK